MQHKFDKIMQEFPGPVLLAVSGGVDSICMAELFYNSANKIPFALAHCNFSLRGQESDEDEALVTAWAENHAVTLFKTRFDTISYAQEHECSIEMAARELRYKWFGDICLEHGFTHVSVAHNANDNAETLFLNLLRGTGVRGLAGMSILSPLPVDLHGENIQILRPLLTFTRKQIEGYALSHGINWREDRTNAEVEFKRNRLRNQVFPLFEKINPSFIRTLNQEMNRFSMAEDILSDWYDVKKDIFLTELPDAGARIQINKLLKQEHWPYLLFRSLEKYSFNSSVVASIEDLLRSNRTISGKSFISSTHQIITTSDSLLIYELSQAKDDFETILVEEPGVYEFCGRSFKISVQDYNQDISLRLPEGKILFDKKSLDFPFYIRNWLQGDSFVPFGMKGRKKVSDFFADRKYTAPQKKNAAMLVKDLNTAANHIFAILCCRIDNSLKVNSNTKQVVVIEEL